MTEQKKRRGPGRPRKPETERRIEKSGQGRLLFHPGDEHPLDVQFEEARRLREELTTELEALNHHLGDLAMMDDPSTQLSREEQALKRYLWEHFKDIKHRDHLLATVLAHHRQHRLARLQAARAALELAADFLQPDEALLHDLQQAREELLTWQPDRSAMDQEHTKGRRTIALQRATESENAKQVRERLVAFETLVGKMRSAISVARGWIEVFMVHHVRLDFKAIAQYQRANQGAMPDEPIWKETIHGPYGKYRWREGKHQYTISLGGLTTETPPDEMPEAWSRL